MSDLIRLTLPVPPSANRWWRMVRGRMIKSRAAREYLGQLRVKHEHFIADGDVAVVLRWYREAKRGDLDKRVPVVLDLLQGIAYENDKQVAVLHASRHEDRDDPRIEVTVSRLPTKD